ncbi:MAG: hypothetical protein K6T88_22040, partial [Bacillus sp. (in: Bacteria)]|nr:hypothetical protein [Bacillus sp. (in: firmicutes)]
MKKRYYLFGMVIVSFAAALLYTLHEPKVQESITFFPIDPKVAFKSIESSLNFLDNKSLIWKVDSTLDRKAYLRQDLGLLFSNGRLIGELGDWKQNSASIFQEKRMASGKSAYYQAITYHHAELHEKNGQIYSSQALSTDHLYVINESINTVYSFQTPKTKEQIQWKQHLDEQTERMLQYCWNSGLRHFSIHLSDYQAFPLNLFTQRVKNGLAGFTREETEKIVGQLWEGLYKNYFLGIKNADGTSGNPLGST